MYVSYTVFQYCSTYGGPPCIECSIWQFKLSFSGKINKEHNETAYFVLASVIVSYICHSPCSRKPLPIVSTLTFKSRKICYLQQYLLCCLMTYSQLNQVVTALSNHSLVTSHFCTNLIYRKHRKF